MLVLASAARASTLLHRATAAAALGRRVTVGLSRPMSSKEGSGAPAKPARDRYRYWLPIQTRWGDNDQYGHVNNTQYYAFFDTVINHFLIKEAGLQPLKSDAIGLCVESFCQYYAPLSYPEIVDAGLYVSHTGRSSLRYEVGIFSEGSDELAAHGHFVHVFVDAETRKSAPIPTEILAKVKLSLL